MQMQMHPDGENRGEHHIVGLCNAIHCTTALIMKLNCTRNCIIMQWTLYSSNAMEARCIAMQCRMEGGFSLSNTMQCNALQCFAMHYNGGWMCMNATSFPGDATT